MGFARIVSKSMVSWEVSSKDAYLRQFDQTKKKARLVQGVMVRLAPRCTPKGVPCCCRREQGDTWCFDSSRISCLIQDEDAEGETFKFVFLSTLMDVYENVMKIIIAQHFALEVQDLTGYSDDLSAKGERFYKEVLELLQLMEQAFDRIFTAPDDSYKKVYKTLESLISACPGGAGGSLVSGSVGGAVVGGGIAECLKLSVLGGGLIGASLGFAVVGVIAVLVTAWLYWTSSPEVRDEKLASQLVQLEDVVKELEVRELSDNGIMNDIAVVHELFRRCFVLPMASTEEKETPDTDSRV